MTFKTMIATSAVALAIATSAMADSNFSGAYIGGNFGYGAGKIKSNVALTNNTTASSELGMTGVIGGLHTGYQHQFGMFILGAEASANLSNTENETTVSGAVESKVRLKRKNAFGLAARAGVAINSWMTYAKLGWENAKFEANADGSKGTARLNAFVTGLGVETVVAKNVMLGTEWTYSFYQNKDSIKPRIGDFKVRLGYKF